MPIILYQTAGDVPVVLVACLAEQAPLLATTWCIRLTGFVAACLLMLSPACTHQAQAILLSDICQAHESSRMMLQSEAGLCLPLEVQSRASGSAKTRREGEGRRAAHLPWARPLGRLPGSLGCVVLAILSAAAAVLLMLLASCCCCSLALHATREIW